MAVKSQQENLNVAKINMLHWMSEHTKQNKIRNKYIREKVRIVSSVEKIVKSRIR